MINKQNSLYLPSDGIKCLKAIREMPQLVPGKLYIVQRVQKSRGLYFLISKNQRPFKISAHIVECSNYFKKLQIKTKNLIA